MTIGHKCDRVKSILGASLSPLNTKTPAVAGAFPLARLALFLQRAGIGRVSRRLAVEIGNQFLGRRRYGDGPLKDDVLGLELFSVDPLVGITVRANRRALE